MYVFIVTMISNVAAGKTTPGIGILILVIAIFAVAAGVGLGVGLTLGLGSTSSDTSGGGTDSNGPTTTALSTDSNISSVVTVTNVFQQSVCDHFVFVVNSFS